MGKFEREFFNRQGEVGILPLLEGWERSNEVPHSRGTLTVEERWERFILLTERGGNDNQIPPTPVAAALSVATA